MVLGFLMVVFGFRASFRGFTNGIRVLGDFRVSNGGIRVFGWF